MSLFTNTKMDNSPDSFSLETSGNGHEQDCNLHYCFFIPTNSKVNKKGAKDDYL